jgi:hypothetical protein
LACRAITSARMALATSPSRVSAVALGGLDGPGLVAPLVDGQHQQAVGQLVVELGRGGGHEQGDGPVTS